MLVIGAHPDDEDTELLTLLTRGEGAETAYLSLNRGEGGQNLIGPELGQALGILRTEELLAARRLDGATQFFTRAYDFGFSRNLEDTWAHWPQDTILKDVVRIVRRFRPQVIVSIFSGTPRDGHGQHQAAGWAAMQAYAVAGDPTRFPELQSEEGLQAWTPLKLYRNARFDTTATTLRLDGAEVDTAAGKTFHQIAMASRSLHRSQDMGQLQTIGPSTVRLALLNDRTKKGAFGFWDGIDTTLAGAGTGAGVPTLRAYTVTIDSLRRRPDSLLAARLLRAAATIAPLAGMPYGQGRPVRELADQLDRLGAAWQAASATLLDVRTGAPRIAPGDSIDLLVEVAGASPRAVTPVFRAAPFEVASVKPQLRDQTVGTRPGAEWRYTTRVPEGEALTQPYFLRAAPPTSMYDWSAAPPAVRGLPFEPPEVVTGLLAAPVSGAWMWREGTWRWNDQARGEVREPIDIVPRVDVKLSPDEIPWRASDTEPQVVVVSLLHGARDTTSGTVRLLVPDGWPAVSPQSFRLEHVGDRMEIRFSVRPRVPLTAGTYALSAVVEDAQGRRYDQGRITISYPYIRARSYLAPATARITVLDLALPAVKRVAYVRGAADRVPEALEATGLPITVIEGAALLRGDLSSWNAIVIGPRAFETDSTLAAANPRLLDYARRGGLVIVQYQQYGFFFGNYAPYPLFVASRPPGSADRAVTTPQSSNSAVPPSLLGGHDRVTDEHAPVTVVDAQSPVLRSPNRLTAADWDGWIQERGLYFARAWAPEYKTVLEMHDPGEQALQGGLLVASVGKGKWVYTGLAFFRQLPAGVPGAYRLFANLLGLNTPSAVP